MPKPSLKRKFQELESEIIDTIMMGGHDYPKSHSDMEWGARALIQKFELKRRHQPLSREDIEQGPLLCAVCGKALGVAVRSLAARRDEDGQELYAHPDCLAK